MRQIFNPQRPLGAIDIADIELDPKSRDDIPQMLRGLQAIYTDPVLRSEVFAILAEMLPTRHGEAVRTDTGRPGMDQWKILVLGVLRLGLNTDYDRIHELANQHKTIREMLGHSGLFDETQYKLDTIKDNLRLFTPEILDRINGAVVRAGHRLVKKSPESERSVRIDSFVVETDVHYPTDLSLLFDAVRKTIETCAALCLMLVWTDWRQSAYWIRQIKKRCRKAQKMTRSRAPDSAKLDAVRAYVEACRDILGRAQTTRWQLAVLASTPPQALAQLDAYLYYLALLSDQVDRRLLRGETIPHHEKVFSIFEPHTEWISKGKAGVPVELGLRVCIVEDQFGFILHHQVMEHTTDEAIAVSIVQETTERFGRLASASMDLGFHSPGHQTELPKLVDLPVLPKKGRLSQADRERENDPDFRRHRRAHSAVESAINALEVHGLDRCPDHGLDGFKRYVALAVVTRNIQRLGTILREQEREAERRRRGPYRKAA